MEAATLYSKRMLRMFPVVLGSLMAVGNFTFASAANNSVVAAQQQTISIKGQVVDTKGESLIGVNVLEKNTSNGTITDYDGNFTLNVSPGAVLVFSYIGYESKEVPASQGKEIKVVLQEDNKNLRKNGRMRAKYDKWLVLIPFLCYPAIFLISAEIAVYGGY